MRTIVRAMNGHPNPGPWTHIRRDLVKRGRPPLVAVVGYVGAGAPEVMPLRRGDMLVCDASPAAIKRRLTSTKALMEYDRIGVSVFSLAGLHAKVIAAKDFSWVGSTNASENSRDNLIEASVRVEGSKARAVFLWAMSQTAEDRALSADDIQDLARLPLEPIKSGPRKTVAPRPRRLPNRLSRLVFYEVSTAGLKEERIAEKSRGSAKVAAKASGLPSTLGWLYWDEPAKAREGDWVVQISNGHVRRPAQVVRVSKEGSARVLWLSYVKTPSRPSVSALRNVIRRLDPDFGEVVVLDTNKISKVLRQFGGR